LTGILPQFGIRHCDVYRVYISPTEQASLALIQTESW